MKLLDFALVVGKLKTLKRTGWINHNVPNPESVAEHSFRTAVLVMVLAPKINADRNKAMKMALVHDIGEAEIGDIVTRKGTEDLPNLKEKLVAERKALERIFSLVDDDEYIKLIDEYEANRTKEARLVKQIDKLEMAIQAYEYEKQHKLNLQDFFDDTATKLVDLELRQMLEEILKLRGK